MPSNSILIPAKSIGSSVTSPVTAGVNAAPSRYISYVCGSVAVAPALTNTLYVFAVARAVGSAL